MLETARLLDAAPLTWGSLGQGILTGKYGADVHFEKDDRRSRAVYDNFYGDKLRRNLRIVDVMRPIAEAHSVSVAAVAVRWILDHLPQSVVIAGMKSPAQAEANAVALTFRLTQDEGGPRWRRRAGNHKSETKKERGRALFCGASSLCLACSITDTVHQIRVVIPSVDAEELRIHADALKAHLLTQGDGAHVIRTHLQLDDGMPPCLACRSGGSPSACRCRGASISCVP